MIFRFERADSVSGDDIAVLLGGSRYVLSDDEPVLETDDIDLANELRSVPAVVETEAHLTDDELSVDAMIEAVDAHNEAVLAAREAASAPGDDAHTAQEQHEPEVGSEMAVPPVEEHEVANESSEDDASSDEEVHY